MKVTTVETIHLRKAHPPCIFVRVYTDEGLVRLGQTADRRTAAVVHDPAARFLIGKEPPQIESLWYTMFEFAVGIRLRPEMSTRDDALIQRTTA